MQDGSNAKKDILNFVFNIQECNNYNNLLENTSLQRLLKKQLLENESLKEMALKYDTTIPKICLRFCYQNHTLPIPKSVHKERIEDNLVFDFEISKEDMDILNQLSGIGSIKPYRS